MSKFVLFLIFTFGNCFASKIEHYSLPENNTKNLPFSAAVRVGDTVYLSGQIGIPPGKSKLVKGGLAPETKQTLINIGLVLKHFSITYKDIVKCQVMLADISEWPAFNKIYQQYFSKPYPARSAFAAKGLAFGARVELECIAIIP
jgi:reactive intermediate/imine deaminase